MTQPSASQTPNLPPAGEKPPQFSLRMMFLAVFTICLVLGIGYAASAASGYVDTGIGIAAWAALAAWFVWSLTISRSWNFSLGTSVLWLLVGFFIVPKLMDAYHVRRPQPRLCKSNMRFITLALLQYENDYQCLPPAYTVDANGNRLQSWRTLILPYLEVTRPYNAMHLDQPWNAPANSGASGTIVDILQCPGHPAWGQGPFTSYVAVVGPDTMWPGEQGRRYAHVLDGVGKTVMVVEINRTDIPWAEPRDLTLDEVIEAFHNGELTGIACCHDPGPALGYDDGAIRHIDPATLDEAKLRALFNINDDAVAPAEEPAP